MRMDLCGMIWAEPRPIWRSDHRQHLFPGQIAEHRPLEAFCRNTERMFNHLQR